MSELRSDPATGTTWTGQPPPRGPEGNGRDSALQTLARAANRVWWVPMAVGGVLVAAGLAALGTDWTVAGLGAFAGALFMFRGLSLVLSPSRMAGSSWAALGGGAAAFVAGLLLVAWPGLTLLVLAAFVGAWLTVSGAFDVITSVAARDTVPHWALTVAVGGVEALLGVWAMRRSAASLSLVIAVLGAWAVITGILSCAIALEMRRAALRRRAEPSV